jgi:hypothetical protein
MKSFALLVMKRNNVWLHCAGIGRHYLQPQFVWMDFCCILTFSISAVLKIIIAELLTSVPPYFN